MIFVWNFQCVWNYVRNIVSAAGATFDQKGPPSPLFHRARTVGLPLTAPKVYPDCPFLLFFSFGDGMGGGAEKRRKKKRKGPFRRFHPDRFHFLFGWEEDGKEGEMRKQQEERKKKTKESGAERKVPQRRNSGMYPGYG